MPGSFVKTARHLRRLFAPKPRAARVDMSGRRVIVTGASPDSLGYETARILASWGASVTVTRRGDIASMESSLRGELRATGADETRIRAHRLDLSDAASVGEFAAWYRINEDGRLDVLINNAGTLRNVFNPRRRPPPSADGFEIHWRTNYLGAFHLTSLLLPLLKRSGLRSGDARVINVSSHLHDRVRNERLFDHAGPYHSWDAYGASKLALLHFSFEIQRRFADRYHLQSAALHPGSVATNLTRVGAPEGRTPSLVRRIGSRLWSLALLPAEHGAQTAVMCASRHGWRGGAYYERCAVAQSSRNSRDPAAAKRLWERSDAWVRTLARPGGNEDERSPSAD